MTKKANQIILILLLLPLFLLNTNKIKASEVGLLFSEYIEGSSNNKALEVFNTADANINLANYKIQSYVNGAATPNYTYIFPSGSIVEIGKSFSVCNSNSTIDLLNKCDATASGVFTFNGNDAIILAKTDGTIIDSIGQIGNNPSGGGWGTGIVSTLNHTLVRKCGVADGDINPGDIFDPAVEWEGYISDTFSYLGSHSLCIQNPTPGPTAFPTDFPSPTSTAVPTIEPTNIPTELPTTIPLDTPTPTPSVVPIETPDPAPTLVPTSSPTPIVTVTPTPTQTSYPPHYKNSHWMRRFFEKCGKFIRDRYEKLHYDSGHDEKKWPTFGRFFRYNNHK